MQIFGSCSVCYLIFGAPSKSVQLLFCRNQLEIMCYTVCTTINGTRWKTFEQSKTLMQINFGLKVFFNRTKSQIIRSFTICTWCGMQQNLYFNWNFGIAQQNTVILCNHNKCQMMLSILAECLSVCSIVVLGLDRINLDEFQVPSDFGYNLSLIFVAIILKYASILLK